jgi:imidazole glycerol-phosphate synthase subunit HisH
VIALIDYGAGNLTSVRKALTACDAPFFTPAAPPEIERVAGIIIPGVGHFSATLAITTAWRDAIAAHVSAGTPLLGICLGMQYLFDGSDEAPESPGLGLIAGRCFKIPATVKVPHVGWNDLTFTRRSRLVADTTPAPKVYFTHSYAAPVTGETVATTDYGTTFTTMVERDNIFGVQFHPEKSSAAGLELLRTFVSMTRSSITRSPDHPITR